MALWMPCVGADGSVCQWTSMSAVGLARLKSNGALAHCTQAKNLQACLQVY